MAKTLGVSTSATKNNNKQKRWAVLDFYNCIRQIILLHAIYSFR